VEGDLGKPGEAPRLAPDAVHILAFLEVEDEAVANDNETSEAGAASLGFAFLDAAAVGPVRCYSPHQPCLESSGSL
jgi:hypothetical protein